MPVLNYVTSYHLAYGAKLDGVPIGGTTGSYDHTWAQFKSWGSVADYKLKISKGLQATGAFSRWGTSVARNGIADFRWVSWRDYDGGPLHVETIYGPYFQGGGSILTNDQAYLDVVVANGSAKYVQAVRAARTKVQGGTVLAELAQTMNLIRRPATDMWGKAQAHTARIDSMRQQFKKLRPKAGKELLGNLWLEVAYGWKPLISDAIGIAEGLAESQVRLARNFEIIRKSYSNTRRPPTLDGTFGHGRLQVDYTALQTRETTVKHLGCLEAATNNPVTQNLALFGFRPEEWIPTAWEIVPYSFLIDYFSNINEVLYAWSYRDAGHRWLQRTVAQRCAVEISTRDQSAAYCKANGFRYEASGGSGCALQTLFRSVARDIIKPSQLIPNFRFKVPGIGQLLNVAALVKAKKGWKVLEFAEEAFFSDALKPRRPRRR